MNNPDGAWDIVRRIEVGRFAIVELANGLVMLENPQGEAVGITSEMLTKLFVDNF